MSTGKQSREAAQHFESLKDRWQRVIEAGQLEEAEEVIEEACQWARAHGDDRQVDSAVCALAAVAIQLGRGEKELPRLREILLRSSDTANCRLAAYHISVYYQYAKNYKRSLFYARIARDRSELLQRADWNASSHNQLGNALLGDSSVDEAAGEYELALALMPREAAIWRARILNNLGYCRALQGRFPEAYTLLYGSLRILRRSGAERYQITTRLDLCYTHLETGRYLLAGRHGRIALALAERAGEVEGVKNALYLLGEAANLTGDLDTAYSYFTRLQGDFFPGVSSLPGFLLAVDVRKLVNLHA